MHKRSTALERPVNSRMQSVNYRHEWQIANFMEHTCILTCLISIIWPGITQTNWRAELAQRLNIPGHRDLLINEDKAFVNVHLCTKILIALTFIKLEVMFPHKNRLLVKSLLGHFKNNESFFFKLTWTKIKKTCWWKVYATICVIKMWKWLPNFIRIILCAIELFNVTISSQICPEWNKKAWHLKKIFWLSCRIYIPDKTNLYFSVNFYY